MKPSPPTHKTTTQVPFAIGSGALVWQFFFFFIPIFLLSIASFLKVSDMGKIEGITLSYVLQFFSPTYLSIIGASLVLALSNSVLCLLIAFPLAYFLAFNGKKHRNIFLFFLIVPFWTNFLLHVYAWFYVLEKHGFLNTLLIKLHIIEEPIALLNSNLAMMIMMVYYYLPFMFLPLFSAIERVNYSLIEASFDLGGSFTSTIRRILLPITRRGIRAGFFLVFIPSFGEFVIPELMGGDRYMFVGTVISQYILGEGTGTLGAAFTLVSGLILIATAIVLYLLLSKILRSRSQRG